MTRTLLTGGSGFIASHVLDALLKRGHSVVTTVRSQEKADQIKTAHPGVSKENLDFVIVPEISAPDAFDKAVVSDPPFEAVIHTASPFHFRVQDVKKDILDPAINGTVGLLKAVKNNAPSVKRVVVTSSGAAILDFSKPPTYTFTEADWNLMTWEEATSNPLNAYRASKVFAEKAAWDFVEKEKPQYSLTTLNPTMVYGPIIHHIKDLDGLNTSNERIRDIAFGKAKEACPYTGVFLWVDVRDLALAHVLAIEKPEAGGQRFCLSPGQYSNKDIVEVIREEFPELRDGLPTGDALKSGDFPPAGWYGYDSSKSEEVLGVSYRPFRDCIVDTVNSLKPFVK
ncbi:Putative Ketoreductase [Aspergillus calidoustus]|uniref:Putative Ketoreductase n=1 Tax=Aspergillus calidoustus TaxID=454130 RepID=A0A0U5CMA4_ASPCI|nr:Putative Ketoreductase [Aspergillus calidoustus]